MKFDHSSRLGDEFLPKLTPKPLYHTPFRSYCKVSPNFKLQKPLLIHDTLCRQPIYRLRLLGSIFPSKDKYLSFFHKIELMNRNVQISLLYVVHLDVHHNI